MYSMTKCTEAVSDRLKNSENAFVLAYNSTAIHGMTQCLRNDDWLRLVTSFLMSFSLHIDVLGRMSECHVLLIESFECIPKCIRHSPCGFLPQEHMACKPIRLGVFCNESEISLIPRMITTEWNILQSKEMGKMVVCLMPGFTLIEHAYSVLADLHRHDGRGRGCLGWPTGERNLVDGLT